MDNLISWEKERHKEKLIETAVEMKKTAATATIILRPSLAVIFFLALVNFSELSIYASTEPLSPYRPDVRTTHLYSKCS